MSGPLATPLFGIHEAALGVQSRRLELISANIANADTPGFQARDVDFAKALGQQQPLSTLRDGAHDYRRNAAQPSLDGNQVDLPMEQAAFADAALRYQASLQFLESRVRGLMTALTGQ
ncbi:MAG: flagellar basal body protein [Polycyclovorans sp.]|jgi:flagellar basal-body rod protein FlgB|nr:flagellar basal body protein [Gammaproteobacteria bacterium]MDP1543293.1 flagellar basal body protein [Polycyclovorans sp.]MEC8850118.1 flagellar basal body protein [Pseudomonadota bacterium]|tara:strand:+ start:71209 stop:71562 length:354 start_codon:yes stop_codon:yes gene_type:complete